MKCKCKCNLFTYGAPRSSKNSFKRGRALPDRIGIWKFWFLRRGENRSTRRKTSRSRVENQQQTQPTYDAGSGNWTQGTLVGGERSHHCANPAPRDSCGAPLLVSPTLGFQYTIFLRANGALEPKGGGGKGRGECSVKPRLGTWLVSGVQLSKAGWCLVEPCWMEGSMLTRHPSKSK